MYAGIDRLIILSQPLAAPTGNRQQEQSPSSRPITKGERLAFPASATLAFGFETLALPEILAITTVGNLRSPDRVPSARGLFS